jgi:hypothetical protein
LSLSYLLFNGISPSAKAGFYFSRGSLAIPDVASLQPHIMANPAADPKLAPLADELKDFAL